MRGVVVLASLLSPMWAHGEALEAALAQCRALEDAARLACYDTLVDRTRSLSTTLQEQTVGVPERQVEEAAATVAAAMQPRCLHCDNPLVAETFALMPHHSNYILPVAWDNHPNGEPYGLDSADEPLDKTEVKFQLSGKSRILNRPLGIDGSLWLAYTQLSLWQAYNSEDSSPFRETNYQPEVFFQLGDKGGVLGLPNSVATLSFNHHSNGRSDELSRSWNRLIAGLEWGQPHYAFNVKAWWRIPEDDEDDDNPDMEAYMGHAQVQGSYLFGSGHVVSLTLRNNFRSGDNRGAGQIDWIFPIGDSPYYKWYIQYFNGYGESLIDYDDSVSRIGIGFMIRE